MPLSGARAILNLAVPALCDHVDQLADLQEARISSTELYVEPVRLIKHIDHRFLVFELQRLQDPKNASLRLDRRPKENTPILIASALLGAIEADDRVCVWLIDDARGSDHLFISGDVNSYG